VYQAGGPDFRFPERVCSLGTICGLKVKLRSRGTAKGSFDVSRKPVSLWLKQNQGGVANAPHAGLAGGV
jgi:hypothetical protein